MHELVVINVLAREARGLHDASRGPFQLGELEDLGAGAGRLVRRSGGEGALEGREGGGRHLRETGGVGNCKRSKERGIPR